MVAVGIGRVLKNTHEPEVRRKNTDARKRRKFPGPRCAINIRGNSRMLRINLGEGSSPKNLPMKYSAFCVIFRREHRKFVVTSTKVFDNFQQQ